MRARKRAWHAANPDYARQVDRDGYKLDGERIRARRRAWYAANRERINAKRRAKRSELN